MSCRSGPARCRPGRRASPSPARDMKGSSWLIGRRPRICGGVGPRRGAQRGVPARRASRRRGCSRAGGRADVPAMWTQPAVPAVGEDSGVSAEMASAMMRRRRARTARRPMASHPTSAAAAMTTATTPRFNHAITLLSEASRALARHPMISRIDARPFTATSTPTWRRAEGEPASGRATKAVTTPGSVGCVRGGAHRWCSQPLRAQRWRQGRPRRRPASRARRASPPRARPPVRGRGA